MGRLASQIGMSLKYTQRAVEKLGLSPCHVDDVKKLNILI